MVTQRPQVHLTQLSWAAEDEAQIAAGQRLDRALIQGLNRIEVLASSHKKKCKSGGH
jgi:hypothetical protein